MIENIKISKISEQEEIHFDTIAIHLIGGIFLFLFSMKLFEEYLRLNAGEKLQSYIAKLASTKWKAIVSGFLIAALFQSSTFVSMMVIGFVSTSNMTLSQGNFLLLGAGLGTTMSGQLVAFHVGHYALLLITFGYILKYWVKDLITTHSDAIGFLAICVGLIFYGLEIASDSLSPLRNYPPFVLFITTYSTSWFLSFSLAIFFTIIIQSSSATIAMAILLTSQNLLSFKESIPIVLGANVGTTFSGLLVSFGKSSLSKRVALNQMATKIIGAIFVYFFQEIFTTIVFYFVVDSNVSRAIAHAHTLFNMFLILLFYPNVSFSFISSILNYILLDDDNLNSGFNSLPEFNKSKQ